MVDCRRISEYRRCQLRGPSGCNQLEADQGWGEAICRVNPSTVPTSDSGLGHPREAWQKRVRQSCIGSTLTAGRLLNCGTRRMLPGRASATRVIETPWCDRLAMIVTVISLAPRIGWLLQFGRGVWGGSMSFSARIRKLRTRTTRECWIDARDEILRIF